MQKRFYAIGAISGFISVGLGAFGAHALKDLLPASQIAIFETAVRYQFYHTFAILFVALAGSAALSNKLRLSGFLFTAGIILFSGSLYLMVASNLFSDQPWKWPGAITPLGGLCFAAGWLSIFIHYIQKKQT